MDKIISMPLDTFKLYLSVQIDNYEDADIITRSLYNLVNNENPPDDIGKLTIIGDAIHDCILGSLTIEERE